MKKLITGDYAVFINQTTKETQGVFEVVGYNEMVGLVIIKKDGEPFSVSPVALYVMQQKPKR